MDRNSVREKIVARLKLMSTRGNKLSITDDTEIYYDLRIFGHDLYDFVVWVEKEFEVQSRINLDEYAPREGMPPLLSRRWTESRERERRPYKSLKICDALAAIEAGHWPVDRAA